MADEVKKADNKSLDALKGQEIKGENVKGGISVTIDGGKKNGGGETLTSGRCG